MKRTHINLIAFAILVLGWSLALVGIVHGLTYYSQRHPAKDKPGYSEIRTIAQENHLTHREVASAVRNPQDLKPHFLKIVLSQTITMGFTLGLFVLIRKVVSRCTEQKGALNKGFQATTHHWSQGDGFSSLQRYTLMPLVAPEP